jgi:hypothetical protein
MDTFALRGCLPFSSRCRLPFTGLRFLRAFLFFKQSLSLPLQFHELRLAGHRVAGLLRRFASGHDDRGWKIERSWDSI